MFIPKDEIKQDTMQLTKMESDELDVITVYKSDQGNSSELIEHLKKMIKPSFATIVCGDLNICYQSNKKNKISKYLENNGFLQLMNEATHIRGGHIDHFYFRPGGQYSENPFVYRYSPYYTDHDAICAAIQITKT